MPSEQLYPSSENNQFEVDKQKSSFWGFSKDFQIRTSSHYLRSSNSRPKFQKATQNVETKLKPTKVWAHKFIWARRTITLKLISKMMILDDFGIRYRNPNLLSFLIPNPVPPPPSKIARNRSKWKIKKSRQELYLQAQRELEFFVGCFPTQKIMLLALGMFLRRFQHSIDTNNPPSKFLCVGFRNTLDSVLSSLNRLLSGWLT